MYENVFQNSPDLLKRLNGASTEEPTLTEIETPVLPTTKSSVSSNGGGSFWERLFEALFGWLIKDDPAPKTEVSAPDPVVTAPEPVTKETVTKKLIFSSDQVRIEEETPEQTGGDPDPIPVAENLEPVQDDPEPIVEDIASTPNPEPIAEEEQAPTPDSVVEEPASPITDAPAPVSVARQIAPTVLESSGAVSVAGGRVTTFSLPDAANIIGITINTLPAHGNVTVNPDFTLALVLSGSDYAGPLSFDYTITRSDGTTQTQTTILDVAEPTQAAGWGLGNHYMLETDANDNIVVEHGDNHRKVYISGSEDALTRADIAAYVQGLEGLENGEITEDMITTQWLRNNPEYGGSEDMALAADVGMPLWYDITDRNDPDSSHWLLFERGYNYGDVGQVIGRGATGESPINPLHVTSWGVGSRPIIESFVRSFQSTSENVVISDLTLTGGFQMLDVSKNYIMDGIKFEGRETIIQNVTGVTLRNSEIIDAVQEDDPIIVDGLWAGHPNRASGVYVSNTDGLLIENNLAHHNGWAEGYDGTGEGVMPPSMYSHNIYLQGNNTDVTLRDNIIAQSASVGAQVRSGGFIEGNLFLDNNVAINWGNDNYTLFADNVTTSAGYKKATEIGAIDWGVRNEAIDSTLLRNIVAHMADPDDAAEIAFKTQANSDPAFNKSQPFFDDTVVYNWNGFEANISGLDTNALDQITIQNFAMELLGLDPSAAPASEDMGLYYKSGLIYALMDYARENWADGTLTTQDIITYFQDGFNIAAEATGDTHHRFVPNDLGDGVRWDNRLNWTSDALPSDGDTVDLGGNWVNFSDTVTLDSLDLGTGGKLQVGSGKLTVNTLETGDNGMIFVERAGQVWTDGYGGDSVLSLQVTGGRFANTGDVSGPVVASVQGGQMILATDDAQFSLGENSELRIEGTAAKIGFDGATGGVATLVMQNGGQLSFIADETGLDRINEFRSGAWDQEGSNVHSGIALDGTLALDLSDYIGTGSMTLIDVDAIIGMFDDVDIHGLGDNRNAELVIDYAADLVTLELSAGAGQGKVSVISDATNGTDEDTALWNALTEALGQGDEPDTSVTVFDDMIDALPDMTFI